MTDKNHAWVLQYATDFRWFREKRKRLRLFERAEELNKLEETWKIYNKYYEEVL